MQKQMWHVLPLLLPRNYWHGGTSTCCGNSCSYDEGWGLRILIAAERPIITGCESESVHSGGRFNSNSPTALAASI